MCTLHSVASSEHKQILVELWVVSLAEERRRKKCRVINCAKWIVDNVVCNAWKGGGALVDRIAKGYSGMYFAIRK